MAFPKWESPHHVTRKMNYEQAKMFLKEWKNEVIPRLKLEIQGLKELVQDQEIQLKNKQGNLDTALQVKNIVEIFAQEEMEKENATQCEMTIKDTNGNPIDYEHDIKTQTKCLQIGKQQIKQLTLAIKTFTHIHNGNMGEAVKYAELMKAEAYITLELCEENQHMLFSYDIPMGVTANPLELGEKKKKHNEGGYLDIADSLNRRIKTAEIGIQGLDNYLIAKEIKLAKKSMRKRKGKK